MKKILILFAHPAVKRSKINAGLIKAIKDLEGITFHDLYSAYPDFLIDVPYEQKLCEEHDVIIFQHPFYWYSTPPILKEWQDLVLQHSWAYGSKGVALKDKVFLQALTGGGDLATYNRDGANMFSIRDLTSPLRATANLCNMIWIPPFAVLGIHRGLPDEEVVKHAEDYRRTLIALREDRLDINAAQQSELLNLDLDNLIKKD